MATLAQVIASVKNYLDKVESHLLSNEANEAANKPFLWTTRTLAASAGVTIDLTTQTGATTAEVDWRSAGVAVLYYDAVSTSPTYQAWVDASAMVSVGVTKAGVLKLGNLTSASIDVIIKVVNPLATPIISAA